MTERAAPIDPDQRTSLTLIRREGYRDSSRTLRRR